MIGGLTSFWASSLCRMAGRKRVPPPPVIREKPVIERVHDKDAGSSPSRKRRKKRSAVDVSDVTFPGVAGETGNKLQRRLAEAAIAFESERFADAHNLLQSIEKLAPGVPEVQELRGLNSYRMGKWRRALTDLEAFEAATGSVDQHPVMQDCHRALGNWNKVNELWLELGEASPSPELIEEGRIVTAGALADQGKLAKGIQMLERAPKAPKKPKIHHYRRWYALADLYERASDFGRARRLFQEISKMDPTFGDAAERARSLR